MTKVWPMRRLPKVLGVEVVGDQAHHVPNDGVKANLLNRRSEGIFGWLVIDNLDIHTDLLHNEFTPNIFLVIG